MIIKEKDQVVSLQTGKKMAKLGFPQDTYFYWRNEYANNPDKYRNIWVLIPDGEWPYTFEKKMIKYDAGYHMVPAYSVAELGTFMRKAEKQMKGKVMADKLVKFLVKIATFENEAESRAKLLIYLVEANLIKI